MCGSGGSSQVSGAGGARDGVRGVVGHDLVYPVPVERQVGVDARHVGKGTLDTPRHDAALEPLVCRVGRPTG